VERTSFDVAEALAAGREYEPKGLHGYDHEHPLMRAIFVARGPAFPHDPNSRISVFQNIEVYNIVCDSLGVVPQPNNGTLRLPFQPEGLHNDTDAPTLETPADPIDQEEKHENEQKEGGETPFDNPVEPQEGDETPSDDNDSSEKPKSHWWKFLHDQLQKAKDWAKQFVDSIKGNKEGQGDPPT